MDAEIISRISASLQVLIIRESRMGDEGGHQLDNFVETAEIELVSVTPEQAQVARLAWRRYGKGNHPAGLNFGDCFAYALAEATQEPLLFKGMDFSLTDIETV